MSLSFIFQCHHYQIKTRGLTYRCSSELPCISEIATERARTSNLIGLQAQASCCDPIGAFYDSHSAPFDNAASIANKTTRAIHASGQALTTAQLAALDTNELQSVGSSIKAADYSFYTRGNGQAAGARLTAAAAPNVGIAGNRPTAVALAAASFSASGLPTAPVYGGVPVSNYRSLRDTDNRYWINGSQWIDFAPSQVKINYSNRSYMVGTDGADSFDSSAYAQTGYFNNNLLTNFLGGGGNDEMGGSVRNDNLWGGTGNDSVYGYAGDDEVYGEEGDDLLLGQDGNDSLDGGLGNDALVGGNGDDVAWGCNKSLSITAVGGAQYPANYNSWRVAA